MSENEKPASPLTSAGPDLSGIAAPPKDAAMPVPDQAAQPAPPGTTPEVSRGRHDAPPSADPTGTTPEVSRGRHDAPPSADPTGTTPEVSRGRHDAASSADPIPAFGTPAKESPAPTSGPAPQKPSAQPASLHHPPAKAVSSPPLPFWKRLLAPFIRMPDTNVAAPSQRLPIISSPPLASSSTAPAVENLSQIAPTPIVQPPVVTFRHVTKIFNQDTPQEYKAIQDIDFEIEDLPNVGEFIALVGPSGCGKSTVLNLIQGFPDVWPPTTGEVLVRNKPVMGPGRDRGMIFQKYSSFPNRTVLQNVLFGLELNSETLGYPPSEMKARAMDMIKRVGLVGHENKYPYQLSGGQQQRVAIARTLVLRPRIILMDEPFSALDEPTRIDMQALITTLWHEVEATVFIVTHSLAEAVYLGDRIFIFTPGPGRIAEKIFIKPADIGKEPGMSPLHVQESDAFKTKLHEITGKFLAYEEGSLK